MFLAESNWCAGPEARSAVLAVGRAQGCRQRGALRERRGRRLGAAAAGGRRGGPPRDVIGGSAAARMAFLIPEAVRRAAQNAREEESVRNMTLEDVQAARWHPDTYIRGFLLPSRHMEYPISYVSYSPALMRAMMEAGPDWRKAAPYGGDLIAAMFVRRGSTPRTPDAWATVRGEVLRALLRAGMDPDEPLLNRPSSSLLGSILSWGEAAAPVLQVLLDESPPLRVWDVETCTSVSPEECAHALRADWALPLLAAAARWSWLRAAWSSAVVRAPRRAAPPEPA